MAPDNWDALPTPSQPTSKKISRSFAFRTGCSPVGLVRLRFMPYETEGNHTRCKN
jgi:hypothetical protein